MLVITFGLLIVNFEFVFGFQLLFKPISYLYSAFNKTFKEIKKVRNFNFLRYAKKLQLSMKTCKRHLFLKAIGILVFH